MCPIKGGCIKPTIHQTTGNTSFPNYPEGLNEQVWCHLFCAYHLDVEVFGNKENLTNINLKKIDPRRFTLRCQVCKTKDGACLQCQHGRCQIAFHPECGKDFFTNTRDKTGYDEVSTYCPAHKPLKLRRILEGKEKKCIEDIVAFCKSFERCEKRLKNLQMPQPIKRTQHTEKPFTYKEKDKLIKIIDKEIKKIEKNNTKEFSWIIKLKSGSLRNKIEVNRPEQYNILDPLALLQNKISIPGRKFTECHRFYTSSLYQLLKQELIVMDIDANIFIPKMKKKFLNNLIKKDLEKYKKFKIREKIKQKRKQKPKKDEENYIQTFIDTPILDDIVTTEVYCICKKPFVEKSFKKPWESEMDFSIRQVGSQMIQCDKCNEWYHYKCIGLSTELKIPDNYICENCKEPNDKENHEKCKEANDIENDENYNAVNPEEIDMITSI